jgi:hypothetical protein
MLRIVIVRSYVRTRFLFFLTRPICLTPLLSSEFSIRVRLESRTSPTIRSSPCLLAIALFA